MSYIVKRALDRIDTSRRSSLLELNTLTSIRAPVLSTKYWCSRRRVNRARAGLQSTRSVFRSPALFPRQLDRARHTLPFSDRSIVNLTINCNLFICDRLWKGPIWSSLCLLFPPAGRSPRTAGAGKKILDTFLSNHADRADRADHADHADTVSSMHFPKLRHCPTQKL